MLGTEGDGDPIEFFALILPDFQSLRANQKKPLAHHNPTPISCGYHPKTIGQITPGSAS